MTHTTIGIDPHKSSHTATAIGATREDLATITVRSSKTTTRQLLAWASRWPDRTWAIEGASGLGHLVAQQLVAHGETVLDVPALLALRI